MATRPSQCKPSLPASGTNNLAGCSCHCHSTDGIWCPCQQAYNADQRNQQEQQQERQRQQLMAAPALAAPCSANHCGGCDCKGCHLAAVAVYDSKHMHGEPSCDCTGTATLQVCISCDCRPPQDLGSNTAPCAKPQLAPAGTSKEQQESQQQHLQYSQQCDDCTAIQLQSCQQQLPQSMQHWSSEQRVLNDRQQLCQQQMQQPCCHQQQQKVQPEQQLEAWQQPQQHMSAWREVVGFALPMLATLAADPLASLVDTAFVGHLGAAQLAGTGMALNIFTSITRLFNAPLLAVTTSTVAAAAAETHKESAAAAAQAAAVAHADDLAYADASKSTSSASAAATVAKPAAAVAADAATVPLHKAAAAAAVTAADHDECDVAVAVADPIVKADAAELTQLSVSSSTSVSNTDMVGPSKLSNAVSSALLLALIFSLVEVSVTAPGAGSLASIWGASAASPLREPTIQFLTLRGLAAPVTVLLLVVQGVFRGLQDAKTPLYATIVCNALNIALEPVFIFHPLHLGVRGSALATALAQTIPLVALLLVLQRRYKLRLRGLDWQQLGAMFAPTGFLLLRTISVSAVFAVATSLVSCAGPLAAAAHQVAFQLWMASSLLADSLAVACQTITARSIAAGQLQYGRKVITAAITMAVALGAVLAVALGSASHQLPGLFSQDPLVQHLAQQLMPIVALSQPLNALAFVLDGVLYGVGGFKYASAIMLVCAAPSLGLMFLGQTLAPGYSSPPQQSGELFAPLLHSHSSSSNWEPGVAASSTTVSPAALAADTMLLQLNSGQSGRLFGATVHLVHGIAINPSLQAYSVGLGQSGLTPFAQLTAAGNTTVAKVAVPGATTAAVGLDHASNHVQSAVIAHMPMPASVLWVWAGLIMLMFMRAVTILLPYVCRVYPFSDVYKDIREQRQQQWQQRRRCSESACQPDGLSKSASLKSLSAIFVSHPYQLWTWLSRGSFVAAAATATAAAAGIGSSRHGDSSNVCAKMHGAIMQYDDSPSSLQTPLLAGNSDYTLCMSDDGSVDIPRGRGSEQSECLVRDCGSSNTSSMGLLSVSSDIV